MICICLFIDVKIWNHEIQFHRSSCSFRCAPYDGADVASWWGCTRDTSATARRWRPSRGSASSSSIFTSSRCREDRRSPTSRCRSSDCCLVTRGRARPPMSTTSNPSAWYVARKTKRNVMKVGSFSQRCVIVTAFCKTFFPILKNRHFRFLITPFFISNDDISVFDDSLFAVSEYHNYMLF